MKTFSILFALALIAPAIAAADCVHLDGNYLGPVGDEELRLFQQDCTDLYMVDDLGPDGLNATHEDLTGKPTQTVDMGITVDETWNINMTQITYSGKTTNSNDKTSRTYQGTISLDKDGNLIRSEQTQLNGNWGDPVVTLYLREQDLRQDSR